MTPQLGEFLRAARHRADLNASELSSSIQRSQTWIYRLENGERADPQSRDLEAISAALHLTPWERRYMYLLAGITPPADNFGPPPLTPEYMERIPQPTAWIGTRQRDNYLNAEFRRVFKGSDECDDMAHWHFGHPLARRIILNWDEIGDWWVATGRLYVAQDSNDPGIIEMLERNLARCTDFRVRWERQIIPYDPSWRRWHIYDIDNDKQLAIDMRIWRHPYWAGAMLTGFVAD